MDSSRSTSPRPKTNDVGGAAVHQCPRLSPWRRRKPRKSFQRNGAVRAVVAADGAVIVRIAVHAKQRLPNPVMFHQMCLLPLFWKM